MYKKKQGDKMKIAMIGHKRIPSREGGVEVVVEALATRMAALGHSVTAYNRRGRNVANGETVKVKEYKGVRIKTIPTFETSKLNAVVYAALAAIAALFGGYDVIHFHAEGPCSMLWLPHLFGIRTVASIHGLDWQQSKWHGFAVKFLKFGEKMAAKYADEIIVLSEETRKYFLDTYGRETRVFTNGVDGSEYIEPNIIKEKYGLEKDNYILFLGRIMPVKGLTYLIEAFSKTDIDKKLVIAGGVSHSDDYAEKIHKMAADERIIFTGFVEGDELWELYHNCFLYVLPSDHEGMPLSLLEAMLCGRECLVSDIPAMTNVLKDYGYTFRRGDVSDLKQKLEEISSLPKRDKSAQTEYIRERYSWDAVTLDTLKLYEKR